MTGSHDRTLKIWDLQHKACEWGGEGGEGGVRREGSDWES